jgi:hypothetical protein
MNFMKQLIFITSGAWCSAAQVIRVVVVDKSFVKFSGNQDAFVYSLDVLL